ncbi:rhodanese-like domain-containing protein [Hymenobacter fodinae]|uniref:Rhodanese-like domain-containing protein n=1 Tax=Hymenobacter fodinae TaxID=2510796 RepID=A0A4Z0P0N9_9BACT|nr:rhodanese-like domain-containing protein [Hymenobacter fodinae]TGE04103.1 rhodanese-like domain-containing protein [Hymenobacter fodinae]
MRRTSCRGVLGWLLLWLVACTTACSQSPKAPNSPPMTAYDRMLSLLYKQTVPTIQPAKLAETLRQHPSGVVLLDTRSPEEYQVSHLPGARFVDFDGFKTATFQDVPRNLPVVVYCTVGARSEQVGARLRSLGFQQVHNLYGGIFQWVNEGHAVYNQAGPTAKVHPYSALWRPWLKRGEPAYQ